MSNPFSSSRLIYRAVDTKGDEAFFRTILEDPIARGNSDERILRPTKQADIDKQIKWASEDAVLGVVICLPSTAPQEAPTTVGLMQLFDDEEPEQKHHRKVELAIDIAQAHQGKGYGSEAIRWALEWAFKTAGLHRVTVKCFGWNDGAKRLYERLGFTYEGRVREAFWVNGQWGDDLLYGMLEDEWRALQKADK